jgi:hypothetical protein
MREIRSSGSVEGVMSNPVLGHAIGIRGDTERYISGGGPVLVLGGGAESL